MTREEAKEDVAYILESDSDEDYKVEFVLERIGKIIDDFESRTCENCKWYDRKSLANFCKNIDSPSTYHQITEVSFGCNKWEAKTVSTDTKSPEQDRSLS